MLKPVNDGIERSRDEAAEYVPLPTPRTKSLRTFLPWQIFRFIMINVKMFRMIRMSHD
jgi:hypothetical protein